MVSSEINYNEYLIPKYSRRVSFDHFVILFNVLLKLFDW